MLSYVHYGTNNLEQATLLSHGRTAERLRGAGPHRRAEIYLPLACGIPHSAAVEMSRDIGNVICLGKTPGVPGTHQF